MCTAGEGAGAGATALGAGLLASGFGAPLGAGLIASGVGTGLSSYAQAAALKQQDNIAAQGIIKQGQIENQANSVVKSTTNSLADSNAATQAASAKQLAAYQAALQQGSGIAASASPDVPGASKAYKAEQTQASGSAKNYVDAIANAAATTEGTQLERVGEGEQMGQAATTLGTLQNQSNEQNYLTKLQVQSTQANPWLEGLGTLLQAGGTAATAGAGLGGSTAGSVTAADVGGTAGGGTIAADAVPGGSIALENPALGLVGTANPAGSPGIFGGVGNYLSAINAAKNRAAQPPGSLYGN